MKMPRVVYTDGVFIFRCHFSDRELPRKAGFRWNSVQHYWYSETPKVAARLRKFADQTAIKEINRVMITNSPWSGPLPFPSTLKAKDFQKNIAAPFALARNRSYIAADPGLGKTVIAAIVANALHTPTVYVSPPFLTRNVEAELKLWGTNGARVVRYDNRQAPIDRPDILIVPDNAIHQVQTRREIFEMVARSKSDPLLIVDEAQRYKTPTTTRTQALWGSETQTGLYHEFPRQVYLSGTPMPNRPLELYPLLSRVAPETIDFMSLYDFGREYCAGVEVEEVCKLCKGIQTGKFCSYCRGKGKFDNGWDFTGASNMKKLQSRVYGTFMLRLRKKDVLKELPPKIVEIVIIGERPAKLIKMESKVLAENSVEDLMAGQCSEHTATYRRELGLIKVKSSVDFISSLLEDTEESILVFAYHREVIAELTRRLERYRPLVVTGSTPTDERHRLVRKFQNDSNHRLFIGNYLAAGIGLTLTKATQVIGVEFSWVPSDNDQAGDRAHRIGQTLPVYHRFLVYENSIDRKVMEMDLKKRAVTNYI